MIPRHLSLELSSYCNLDCEPCMRKYMKREPSHMSMDTARMTCKQSVDFASHLEHVTFNCWGESTLNPNCVEMIQMFKKIHWYLVLHTNCTTFVPELDESGLYQLVLHVSSVDGIRYENAVRYLQTLKKIPNILIQFLISPSNQHLVEEFIHKFREYTDKDRVQIYLKYPIQEPNFKILFGNLRDDVYKLLMLPYILVGGSYNQLRGGGCGRLRDLVVVLADGTLMLECCSPDPLWEIGRIEDGIVNCFNSDKVQKLRQEFPNIEPCKLCYGGN